MLKGTAITRFVMLILVLMALTSCAQKALVSIEFNDPGSLSETDMALLSAVVGVEEFSVQGQQIVYVLPDSFTEEKINTIRRSLFRIYHNKSLQDEQADLINKRTGGRTRVTFNIAKKPYYEDGYFYLEYTLEPGAEFEILPGYNKQIILFAEGSQLNKVRHGIEFIPDREAEPHRIKFYQDDLLYVFSKDYHHLSVDQIVANLSREEYSQLLTYTYFSNIGTNIRSVHIQSTKGREEILPLNQSDMEESNRSLIASYHTPEAVSIDANTRETLIATLATGGNEHWYPRHRSYLSGPAQRHIAFLVKENDQAFLNIDQYRYPKGISRRGSWTRIVAGKFSPDGSRLATVEQDTGVSHVRIFAPENKQYLGQEFYYSRIDYLSFSPDSRHLVYSVYDNDRAFVVVDNHESSLLFDKVAVPTYSPDGQLLVYAGKRNGQWYMVENETVTEKTISGISEIQTIFFRPGTQEYYVVSKNDNTLSIMVNGTTPLPGFEPKEYGYMTNLVQSDDG